MLRVTHGLTSVTVLPEEIGTLWILGRLPEAGSADPRNRAPTGARVIVEFAVNTVIPARTEVAVPYDLAGNGGWRECRGIPQYAYRTALADGQGATHHYRLSQWIAAGQVMHFVQTETLQRAA